MFGKYKRPRFTEDSEEDENEHAQIISAHKGAATDIAKTSARPYSILASRKRRRFTEESDDDIEGETPAWISGKGCSSKEESPVSMMKWIPPSKSILKQQLPNEEAIPKRLDPPTDREFRKVFISNIDATLPGEEAKAALLKLMQTHGIPCEPQVHILPPNIEGRHHRGVAWITLEHQDDIDKAINRLNRTKFGTRLMKAKLHENPMLSATKAQASYSSSTPTFSVSRGGFAPSPLPLTAMIPPWQKKLASSKIVPRVKKDSDMPKKIFVWNIDNNKTEEESKSFIYKTLAAQLGSDVVVDVSCRSKGMKVYAFVEFTRANYVTRAVDIINGVKFGIKHLGAQVHQTRQVNRKSVDLDFHPW